MTFRTCTVVVIEKPIPQYIKTMDLKMKSNGLSARRRAINSIQEVFCRIGNIIKRWTILSFIAGTGILLTSCHEKTNGQNSSGSEDPVIAKQETPKPRVNVKVNRHYDEKGNLIGFDSTYSTFYSDIPGNIGMDSVLNSFDKHFRFNQSFFDDHFTKRFFNDSLFYYGFPGNGLLHKDYDLNDPILREMMKRRFFEWPGKSRAENEKQL